MGEPGHEVTALLLAWRQGEDAALRRLIPLVYEELHRIASSRMAREREGNPLQATALVHEVYLRLIGLQKLTIENRAHFVSLCAQTMRRVLIDLARSRNAMKRDRHIRPVSLDQAATLAAKRGTEFMALDDALDTLEKLDARKARVVEMRFFGGMSVNETALVLGVSPETIMRDWRLAKNWLSRELAEGNENDTGALGSN